MADFFSNLAKEDIDLLDRLSMLLIELRETRDSLLERYKIGEESELLQKIEQGLIEEHPAYEDYLGIKVIINTREEIRKDLNNYMLEMK